MSSRTRSATPPANIAAQAARAHAAAAAIAAGVGSMLDRGDALLATVAARGPSSAAELREFDKLWAEAVAAAERLAAAVNAIDRWAADVIGPPNA